MSSSKDNEAAMMALVSWFESQDIELDAAIILMCDLVATLLCSVAEDPHDLARAIKLVSNDLSKTAAMYYQQALR